MSRLAPFSQANQNSSPAGRILRHPPPPNAPPVEAPSHFVVQGRCFQRKRLFFCIVREKKSSSYLQNGRGRGGDGVLRSVFVALTQEVLSAGASFMPSGKENSLTHTHTHTLLSSLRPLLPRGFIYSSNYNKQARTSRRGRFPCLHQPR